MKIYKLYSFILAVMGIALIILCVMTHANTFAVVLATIVFIALAAFVYYLPSMKGKSINYVLKSKIQPHDFGDITLDNVVISQKGRGLLDPSKATTQINAADAKN